MLLPSRLVQPFAHRKCKLYRWQVVLAKNPKIENMKILFPTLLLAICSIAHGNHGDDHIPFDNFTVNWEDHMADDHVEVAGLSAVLVCQQLKHLVFSMSPEMKCIHRLGTMRTRAQVDAHAHAGSSPCHSWL